MKQQFIEFRKKTKEEIKGLWDHGIICFDTNILLNLYRYSDTTRETIIDLIDKLKDRVALPHQVALEYNRKRFDVICDQENEYKSFINKIKEIQEEIQKKNKPPFLSNKLHDQLNEVNNKIFEELEFSQKKYEGYLNTDPIYERINEIFEKRITKAYTPEELKAIHDEGEKRFKEKIPPGYEDFKKEEGNRKYGDLVLWKQIIDLAKEKKKSIIFVTDEKKKDWWWKVKGDRTIGPRFELIEEIKKIANVDFHMYSSERFLSFGKEHLQESVNNEALKEIKEFKTSKLAKKKKEYFLKNKIEKLHSDINEYQKILLQTENDLRKVKEHRRKLYESIVDEDDSMIQEHAHNLGYLEAEHIEEKENLQEKIENLKKLQKKNFWQLMQLKEN